MPFKRFTNEETYVASIRDKSKPTSEQPIFNPLTLKHTMLAPFESFAHLGVLGAETDPKFPGRHIYIDRGSKVLGVAHLDSVNNPTHFWCNSKFIAAPTIDNRMGAWILLHGLPSMGIYPDVLLTENEESCNSTGEDFQPTEVKWNWMFSFDRKDNDVVLYQYGFGQLQTAIKEHGFTIGQGSYSDISSMGHLHIEGANFGCGMQDYHSAHGYVLVEMLTKQLLKFAKLWKTIEHTKFPWEERPSYHRKSKRHSNGANYTAQDFGDSMYYGENYYRNRNQTLSSIAITTTRRDALVAGLRRDCERVNVIFGTSISKYLANLGNPTEWRDYAYRPEGVNHPAYRTWFTCRDCDLDFDYADAEWSSYFGKNFCRACWLERMDFLELLPTDWRKTLKEKAVELKEKQDVQP